MATNSGVLTTPSGSVADWNDSQHSRKCYTHNYSFTIRNINQGQSNEEMHREKSNRVPNAKLPYL